MAIDAREKNKGAEVIIGSQFRYCGMESFTEKGTFE